MKPNEARSRDDRAAILLVDDCHDTRHIMASMLSSLDVELVEAHHAVDALAILEQTPIDVVVSDFVMPKMSGTMFLHSMLERGYHIPFILVSGFADKESAIQALRLGAFDFLEKPIDPVDLCSVVQDALNLAHELRLLSAKISKMETMHNEVQANLQAELAIMKMRMLRHHDASQASPVPTQQAHDWQTLCDFFVQESLAQITFAENSLARVATCPEIPQHELFYLTRIMQSIHQTSESLRLHDISRFARSLESGLNGCRQQDLRHLQAHIGLFTTALGVLRAKIVALQDHVALRLQQSLDALSEPNHESGAAGADKQHHEPSNSKKSSDAA